MHVSHQKEDLQEARSELQKVRVKYAEDYAQAEEKRVSQKKATDRATYTRVKRRLQTIKRKAIHLINKEKSAQGALNGKPSAQNKFNHQPYTIRANKPGQEKRVKVLHAIPTFSTGGSQQLIVDIIENIPDCDHYVLISRRNGPIGYIGIPIEQINVYEQGGREKIGDYLQALQPELFHIHFWATIDNVHDWYWYHILYQEAFRLNLKVIQNCNNPTFPYFDDRIRGNIYVSNYAKNTFGLNAPLNTVVYPGSNFDLFKSDRQREFSDTIGMVYRLENDKLNKQSIEPFIEAIKKRPETRALIVGGGSLFNHYKQRVEEEGLSKQFDFPGYVPYNELPAYYEKIDIFITPVHQESFGQVTPFAMNMGIPVAGYDVGALAEIIADRSLLAAKGNSAQLSDIIVQLLDDKKRLQEISLFNRQRAQQLFSLTSMITAYNAIYQAVLSEGKIKSSSPENYALKES